MKLGWRGLILESPWNWNRRGKNGIILFSPRHYSHSQDVNLIHTIIFEWRKLYTCSVQPFQVPIFHATLSSVIMQWIISFLLDMLFGFIILPSSLDHDLQLFPTKDVKCKYSVRQKSDFSRRRVILQNWSSLPSKTWLLLLLQPHHSPPSEPWEVSC